MMHCFEVHCGIYNNQKPDKQQLTIFSYFRYLGNNPLVDINILKILNQNSILE